MQIGERAKKWLAVSGIAIAVVVSFLLWKSVGRELVAFVADPVRFRQWVQGHGAYSRIAFVGMVIFQILIAIIPGEPFEIAAGYAFGAVEGTALCVFAATVGSLLTFWMVRLFGLRLVRVFFSEEQIDSVKFLKSSPRRDMLFLIIYMVPGTPKDLLSYFAGLTDLAFPSWLLICSLGRIPSVVSSTIGGAALGTQNYWLAAVVFAATLVISGAGLLAYNHICRTQKDK